MRTPADLAAFIHAHGIAAELITDIGDTPTVSAAAAALGVSDDEIIKTLIFFIGERPHAVITHGSAPVPPRPLADFGGVGRRQIKLARGDEVVALTGYPPGGVPPFGHLTPLPVLLARSVLALPVIFGGGGDDRTMMRLSSPELLRVTAAALLDLN